MRDLQRDRPLFNEVWAERFGEHRPARSAMESPAFGRPGENARFMIEVAAYLREPRRGSMRREGGDPREAVTGTAEPRPDEAPPADGAPGPGRPPPPGPAGGPPPPA